MKSLKEGIKMEVKKKVVVGSWKLGVGSWKSKDEGLEKEKEKEKERWIREVK